jgi:uncharacterized protein YegP (UPF0339 family)
VIITIVGWLMAAKYVLSGNPSRGFHWNLVATNGRTIASSQHYETRRAAMQGIASCRKNAPTEVVEEVSGDEIARKLIH